MMSTFFYLFFFFKDTATTEIYTLSLHDALPILSVPGGIQRTAGFHAFLPGGLYAPKSSGGWDCMKTRSEEHTSELQSQSNLVCRLLLEKKKINKAPFNHEVIENLYNLVFEYESP